MRLGVWAEENLPDLARTDGGNPIICVVSLCFGLLERYELQIFLDGCRLGADGG